MLKKIKNWFIDLQIRFALWKSERKLAKEFDSSITLSNATTTEIHEDAVQAAILEGVRRIQKKAKEGIAKDGFEGFLRKTDLLDLAHNGNDGGEKIAQVLKQIHVGPEIQQNDMINKRINHYYELQQAKLKREEARKARAKQEG